MKLKRIRITNTITYIRNVHKKCSLVKPRPTGLFSVVTVFDAVSAAILPVWVDFTSLKGLPCAPGPATTRRGMLVTNC